MTDSEKAEFAELAEVLKQSNVSWTLMLEATGSIVSSRYMSRLPSSNGPYECRLFLSYAASDSHIVVKHQDGLTALREAWTLALLARTIGL